jgi:diguanylate cyclase (GGDEF)-like protein
MPTNFQTQSDAPLVTSHVNASINPLVDYAPLTHLPNRSLLKDRLAQALAVCTRSGFFGALFFINVNNFHGLNDAEGHEAGDLLLLELATRLRAAVCKVDTVARQWDDEFLILAENLADTGEDATHQAQLLGDRLRAILISPVILKNYEYTCRISIGVSLFQPRDTVESIFNRTGLALHRAKKSGHNALCFFESAMQHEQERRSVMSAELEKALAWQQFRVYYQPQVDNAQRVIGVEALLRWQHPLHGLVMPGEFIALAEELSLIAPLGLFVLKSACAQLKRWEHTPHTCGLQIAVNVSAQQFHMTDFVAQVQGVLKDSGANPLRLKLELTESLMLNNIDDVIEKMDQIKQLGVSFSMDDFGTGYSSLSYLAHLPIDQLKIDKSFIQQIPGKKKDEIIVQIIISMGQSLGMDVIAEGVETEVQRAFLTRYGCHAYQGYLFSRPLSIEQLDAYLLTKSTLLN